MELVSVHMTQSYTCSTHSGVYFHGHNLQCGKGEGGGGEMGKYPDGYGFLIIYV